MNTINYLETASLSDELRDKIFGYALPVFVYSSEVHPLLDMCSVDAHSPTSLDALRVCRHFEFEEDQTDDLPTVTCAHCFGLGSVSCCEKFVDPIALEKECQK